MTEMLYQWQHRRLNRRYYNFVMQKILAIRPDSLIEIGPHHALLSIGYFVTSPKVTMLDKIEMDPFSQTLFAQAGIQWHQKDVLADNLTDIPRHDCLVCLQVLEHIEKPFEFVQRIWHLGKIKIFSVPYLWQGDQEYHIHTGIDAAKFLSWFPEDPITIKIIREDTGHRRIIGRWEDKQ